MGHPWVTLGEIAGGLLVGAWLLDRLIRWAERHGSSTYDDPTYVPGSFNPLGQLFEPGHKHLNEMLESKRLQGDDDETDGAPPAAGDPARGSGPTSF